MKKVIKSLIASCLVASMCMGITGCMGAPKKCKEAGLEFIQLAFDKEFEDMADMCTDDDEALEFFAPYDGEFEPVDMLLERATVEYSSNSKKNDTITVVFRVDVPDYDAVLDEDPEDIDEYEDLLDETTELMSIEIHLEFVEKKGEWLVDNYDDFVEDLYGELYGIDFGFQSEYEGWVASENWWGANGTIYTGERSYLDLDLTIGNDHYYDDITYSFQVFKSGSLIYTSNTITDYGFLENYCYCENTNLGSEYFPTGAYTFVLYDAEGVEFYTSSCTVQ